MAAVDSEVVHCWLGEGHAAGRLGWDEFEDEEAVVVGAGQGRVLLQVLLGGGEGCVAGAYERAARAGHGGVEAGELFVVGDHDVVVGDVDESFLFGVVLGVVV